jgi:hypothetical protein
LQQRLRQHRHPLDWQQNLQHLRSGGMNLAFMKVVMTMVVVATVVATNLWCKLN